MLSPQLYDRQVKDFQATYSQEDIQESLKLRADNSYENTVLDVQMCIDKLRADGCEKVFITGYCYGGSVSWVAACRARGLDAASCYYGGAIKQCQNVASRMVQKNALMHSQAAYWVSIVVVQWADLLICKTRWLSIKQQGLRNSVLNFGLFFETLLAAWLCYGGVFSVLGTQPIRFTHWMPGVPWSMMIFMYDETRKYLMRATSPEVVDAVTGAVKRQAGWIEKSTYY